MTIASRSENESGSRSPGRGAEVHLATALLGGVAAFQAALALGAPWGAYAWGGGTEGTLPVAQRLASAVAVPVYLGLAALVRRGPTTPSRRRVLRATSVLLGVGTALNAISPSSGERLLWTPVAASLAVLLWRRASSDVEP